MTIESTVDLDGTSVPRFFYGTAWKEDATEACVLEALRAGFRAIDTANQRKHYFEKGVGDALRAAYSEGIVKREKLFIQTKFTYQRGQDHRLPYDPDADFACQVVQSFESSLEHLGTDYIDSYILHGPYSGSGIAAIDAEVWGAMEQLKRDSHVKLIGVSNVSLDQLKELYEKSSIKPAFVQNRCYARTGWDREVRRFCNEKGIYYQGFSLLTANREIFNRHEFLKIASKHGITEAQTIFAFALQVGMLLLTGTTNPRHMQEDLAAAEVELNLSELETVEGVAQS